MRPDFDGADLLVGEITALRTFDLRAGGSLWPVFAADRAWADGPNEARCGEHAPAGAPRCMCGYWAYGSPTALRDQPRSRNVIAVVSCWGRVTPGTRGVRAQFARIDALWLSRRVPAALVASVAARYPGVAIYRDRAQMLAAHPVTALPSYVPDRPFRHSRTRIATQLVNAIIGASIVCGFIPAGVYHQHPLLRSVTGQFQLMLAYIAVSTVIQYLAARGRDPARARLVMRRLMPTIAALLLWVWAPFTPLPVDLVMRVPALVWMTRIVLNWGVRYLPSPAPPRPPPTA